MGLNRTSVGLKLIRSIRTSHLPGKPQSNQRGIETFISFPPFGSLAKRLNRTSVGLKLLLFGWTDKPSDLPQSNQRGIETPPVCLREPGLYLASIEPAWD